MQPNRPDAFGDDPPTIIGVTIHHLQLWVPDLVRAEESWGWLLGELGYREGRRWDHGLVWRQGGTGIVIEQSPDMVPGMLHSRLRPGMNHVAFHVADADTIARLAEESTEHGWKPVGHAPGHPMPSSMLVSYLEDRDGFEVELVSPASRPS